jgi:hypothetical protein
MELIWSRLYVFLLTGIPRMKPLNCTALTPISRTPGASESPVIFPQHPFAVWQLDKGFRLHHHHLPYELPKARFPRRPGLSRNALVD